MRNDFSLDNNYIADYLTDEQVNDAFFNNTNIPMPIQVDAIGSRRTVFWKNVSNEDLEKLKIIYEKS